MATIQQIQKGFATFVDREVAGAYSGIEKALVLGSATLLAANLPNLVTQFANHPMVTALGVYHAEEGSIDMDALYQAFVPHIGGDKIPLTLPRIGKMDLGTIKLGKEEIDLLMKYIKEA